MLLVYLNGLWTVGLWWDGSQVRGQMITCRIQNRVTQPVYNRIIIKVSHYAIQYSIRGDWEVIVNFRKSWNDTKLVRSENREMESNLVGFKTLYFMDPDLAQSLIGQHAEQSEVSSSPGQIPDPVLNIFFCIFLFGLRWRFPPLPWVFTVWHNDPAAPQDHGGTCRIQTRDLCLRSLVHALYCTVGCQPKAL